MMPDVSSCDASSMVALIIIGIAGLVVSFAGYRLYVRCFGMLGFLLFAGLEGINGRAWLDKDGEHDGDHVAVKKAIIVSCCLLWGVMGAFIFMRVLNRFQRVLGFLLGALIGVLVVRLVIFGVEGAVNEAIPSDFQGWDAFTLFTVGVPVAVLVGYLMKNSVSIMIMISSSIGGAAVVSWTLQAAIVCSEVEWQIAKSRVFYIAIIVVIGVLGFAVQYKTRAIVGEKSDFDIAV
eukprot:TRINITY_DN40074_c0_g1_i1.p1 TRINITY_DN40074_c0_g1~~TRINITY_DN40074_c0_g1_i1.p1  ORF type:complete len:253 (+),score=31.13 TRINITY_DN40074_c0_g1_i1:60-761(+)